MLEDDAWSEMRDGNLISADQSEFEVLATGTFVAVIRVLVIRVAKTIGFSPFAFFGITSDGLCANI